MSEFRSVCAKRARASIGLPQHGALSRDWGLALGPTGMFAALRDLCRNNGKPTNIFGAPVSGPNRG